MLKRFEFCFYAETIHLFSCYLVLKSLETYLLGIMPVQRDKFYFIVNYNSEQDKMLAKTINKANVLS